MTDHRGTAAGIEAFTSLDPRHVFLDAHQVMHRYGWGKTRGYQNLKDRNLVHRQPSRTPTAGGSTSCCLGGPPHGRDLLAPRPRHPEC